MADAVSALHRFRPHVAQELRDVLRGAEQHIYDMQRYHLGWQEADGSPAEAATGKLFRPAFLLLCCQAVGGDYERALPAAAAIELLHNFSLIHDDIEDESRLRHGRKTVWAEWGIANGINAGDSMFVMARLALHRLAARDYTPQTILNAFLMFDRACQRLCEGQDLDLGFESTAGVSMDEYLQMIAGKTGALIATSAAMGALLGDAAPHTVVAFDRFGRLVGRAFQIADDVLGVWGDEEKTGKPTGEDIRSRKKSFPIVHALEVAQALDRQRLLGIYGQASLSDDDIAIILDLFDRYGVRAAADRAAREATEHAITLLAEQKLASRAGDELEALARYVAERDA
ncbi:MAG: polyprenyl synthetase family protein [Dehalococcoidia bacterium]